MPTWRSTMYEIIFLQFGNEFWLQICLSLGNAIQHYQRFSTIHSSKQTKKTNFTTCIYKTSPHLQISIRQIFQLNQIFSVLQGQQIFAQTYFHITVGDQHGTFQTVECINRQRFGRIAFGSFDNATPLLCCLRRGCSCGCCGRRCRR